MKKCLLMLSGVVFTVGMLMAQAPANDHCSGAIELVIYDSEAEAIPVEMDTRNTTDGALDNVPVCSANFYRDDVWASITGPVDANEAGYAIKVYYGQMASDVVGFGMALYNSCDGIPANQPFFCANSPGDDQGLVCIAPGETIYIRVWSADGDAANWQAGWGTFRIAVFPREIAEGDQVTILWGDLPGEGDFDGGLNEWTLEGMQCNGTDPSNALWEWTTSGFPFYIFGPYGGISPIKSRTFCNGSMIFDSGFLMFGEEGTAGSGPCPWDVHEGALTSPIIDISAFDVEGVSLLFNQSMQRFSGGQHFIDFSTDGGTSWTSLEINTEKTFLSTNAATGEGYYNEEYRVRLSGAEGSNNLRVRFRFLGGAYWWVIDDVRIIETECSNTQVMENWYTIAPWAIVPPNQVYPFPVMADVVNRGACLQTNVNLNYTVENAGGTEVYNEDLNYGEIPADVLVENELFPELVTLPAVADMYNATFTLTQDLPDFDPSNNTLYDEFEVGGHVFALENGANRTIAPATASWAASAPRSWAYGNYFHAVNDAKVDFISWGVNNPAAMENYTVNIVLYQWTDVNGDAVSSFNERTYVGFGEHTFTGTEGENAIINTVLDNIDNPGQPVMMRAGMGYIAIVEYQAFDANDPSLILLGNSTRAYNPIVFAFDQAFDAGLTDFRVFASILAVPMDGNLAQIDYSTSGFNTDLVPVVRIQVDTTVNTKDELPINNLVSAFPNPAVDMVHVKLEFEKSYSDVRFRLIDNTGKTVYHKSIQQAITQHVESINVSQFAAGNYMLQVETPDGQRSIPVIIVK